ncbi:MAG: CotH kinase family protein, partial [Ruminococcus sp.]|nr:CotH kinase family protein [Ruminococcus sp.]
MTRRIRTGIISILLILMTLIGMVPMSVMAAEGEEAAKSVAFSLPYQRADGLYAYGGKEVSGTNAWQRWDSVNSTRYFYLPPSASDTEVIILNTYSSSVTVNNVKIPAGEYMTVPYTEGSSYTCSGATTQTLKIYKTDAEGAIYVNSAVGMVTVNDNSSKTETTINDAGYDVYSFLTGNTKNREVKNLDGAVASEENGVMDGTTIKKMKGRGNTTWDLAKKPFNITYKDNIQLDGMKGKKWSLLANAQDSSLIRNRLIYDISHEVGMNYACDSRFVDMFVNGDYKGSYQLTQKIELGKNTVMPDLEEPIVEEEVDEDTGETLVPPTADFDFVLEIDMAEKAASAGDLTFKSSRGQVMTHKVPDEPTSAQISFMKQKYNAFEDALYKDDMKTLEKLIDIEDLARAYLINELAKNLDGALTSCYFVYNSDEGKFYASPVWDYDNGVGNTIGIDDRKDINGNVLYITNPSGWYTKEVIHIDGNFDKSGDGRTVFSEACYMKSRSAENKTFMDIVNEIWAADFADLEEILTGVKETDSRLKSIDEYTSLLKKSGEWNYSKAGWTLNNNTNNSWISNHSSLSIYKYDKATDNLSKTTRSYNQTSYTGQVDYAADWLLSRFNWLNAQFTEVEYSGEYVTVYFAKDSNWSNAYIYAFYGEEGGTPTEEWTGGYPGMEMTFVEIDKNGNSIYSAEVPADIDFIKFSDGSSTNRRTENVSNSKISDGVCFGIGSSVGTNKWDVSVYDYTPANPTPQYTVVFKDFNGTVISTQTVEEGKSATAPEAPVREADSKYTYTFKEWDKDFSAVTGNLEVNAVYTQTLNKYTVTFKDYDGTELSAQTVEYGASAVAPADPEREGYRFTGWDKEFDNITSDTVVTAKYTKVIVTPTTGKLRINIMGGTGFKISVNGGSLRPQGTYYNNTKTPIGASVTVVANMVDGVEFLGWMNESGAVVSASDT